MSELGNPHDRFFKEVFARLEVAQDFLRHYLPKEVADALDLTTLELQPDSFIDAALQAHFSDMLYKVRLRDGPETLVYVLFEHKSYADPLIAWQLLRYMMRIWELSLKQRGRLQPVFPLVVYHGRTRWQIADDFQALLKVDERLTRFVPQYHYCLCDLSEYDDDELKGELFLQIALRLLKYVLRDELAVELPGILALFQRLGRQQTVMEYLETVLRYLSTGTDKIGSEDVRQAVYHAFPEDGEEIMGTLAEKWMEQGHKQGLRQGLQQGLQQGEQKGLREGLIAGLELGLELKFGNDGVRLLPEIYRIEDVNLLRAVHEGLKTAQSVTDVRRIYAV